MTSTTFDRSYMHRKGSHKDVAEGEGANVNKDPHSEGTLTSSDSTTEVKSDPETESASNHTPKPVRASKLSKHGSFSFGHSSIGGAKESRLLKPAASKAAATAEDTESVTPPTQSKLKALAGGSKLQLLLSHKVNDTSSSGDAPEESTANEQPESVQRPQSRLKFPGSGRNTPSGLSRSGLQQPSSRLSKKGSSSSDNLLHSGTEGEPSHSGKTEKQLRLQRKGSDGAVKRHLVNPSLLKTPHSSSVQGHLIQLGTNSLPRHLPKGSLEARQPSNMDGEERTEGMPDLISSVEDKERATTQKEVSDQVSGKNDGGMASGLKRPGAGGLKKPGVSMMSAGVRTPNLPSSGPQSSTTSEGEGRDAQGGGARHMENSSPGLGGKKLMQPKATAAGMKKQSLESRLKRSTSPSTRNKLYKITPAPAGQSFLPKSSSSEPGVGMAEPGVGVAGPLPPSKGQEMGGELSTSSLEAGETHAYKHPAQQKAQVEHASSAEAKNLQSQQDVTPVHPSQSSGSSAYSASQEVSSPMEENVRAKDSHLRIGRRISPEGMSHEEITSPKVESPLNCKDSATPPQSPTKVDLHSMSAEDAESATSTEKETATLVEGENNHQSRYEDMREASDIPSKVQRARSLSPKSPYRLMPKGVHRVRELESRTGILIRTHSSESTSSEGGTPVSARKPLKSSLRQKRSGSKSRHSSSSSLEGVITSPGLRPNKVTISPRSSQVCKARVTCMCTVGMCTIN